MAAAAAAASEQGHGSEGGAENCKTGSCSVEVPGRKQHGGSEDGSGKHLVLFNSVDSVLWL